MLVEGKISIRQFTILVFLITIGDSILVIPSTTTGFAKQDVWIAGIVALIAGLLTICLFSSVGRLYPSRTLIEYNEKILGTWLGKFASMLFLVFVAINTTSYARSLGAFIVTAIMPETPIEIIILIFIFATIIGVRLGLETLARIGELLFPWFILLFFSFFLFLSLQIDLENFQPILAKGFKPVFAGSIVFTSFPFMELVVLLMIIPFVNRVDRVRKGLIIGSFLGGLVLITITFLCIAVLGVYLTSNDIFPSYTLAKKISIGGFLERVEAILAVMWFITLFFKFSVYFYSLNLGLAQVLKCRDLKILTIPVGILMFTLSTVIAPNLMYLNYVGIKYWPFFDFTFSVILPLLLLGVYTVRKWLKAGIG